MTSAGPADPRSSWRRGPQPCRPGAFFLLPVRPLARQEAGTVEPAKVAQLARLLLELVEEAAGRAANQTIAGGLPFSPTEQAILDALAERGQLTGKQIASAIRQPFSSGLRTLLSNLAERHAIESGPAGYQLPVSPEGC